MSELETLIARLQAIAKKNDDQFRYWIAIDPPRPAKSGGPRYSFICEECADNHIFLQGSGASIAEAVAAASKDVKLACQEWGYETTKAVK